MRLRGAMLLLALGAALAVLFALPGAAATLTPPPTGDWTIDPGENAVLLSGSTTVIGNINVNGTLTVSNATLVMQPPAPGVTLRIALRGATLNQLVLDNATLRGASAGDRYTIDSGPGADILVQSTLLQGLGNTTQGDLDLVGTHLLTTTLRAFDTTINASDGGFGLDQRSTLTSRNLNITVTGRALYLSGTSTAVLDDFRASGNLTRSEFLVLVNSSSITGTTQRFDNATNLLLLLSAVATLSDATFEHAAHAGALVLGSTLTLDGAFVAPRAIGSLGIEAYGSNVTVARARFQNYTFGISGIGSSVNVANGSFQTSNETPKSSFTGIYLFDGEAAVRDSEFNGLYHVTTINITRRDQNGTVIINQTTGLPEIDIVEVWDCSNSALWFVRSRQALYNVTTECFNTHIHSEDSDTTVRGLRMDNGTVGLELFIGNIDAEDVFARNFTTPSGTAVVVSFYNVEGRMTRADAAGSDTGAEFRGSAAVLSNFVGGSPGLGVLVVSGAPTIVNSTFSIHNETGVRILGGTPLILNSTFWLTADRMETFGVVVGGGAPVIAGNEFHGTYLLTYGVRVDIGPAIVEGNRFYTLERAAQFYSKGFVASGNTFEECWNGAEARDGSVGTISENAFVNMTGFGAGNGVNVYYSGATVSSNTFLDVNYGIKVFFTNTTLGVYPRISGNRFDNVSFYAIEIINATVPVLLDNNTVRNATRGGIELLFSRVVSAYNVVFDGDGYGYEITQSNLTIVGGRLENLREGIHGTQSALLISYTTFLLNHAGMTVQDAPVSISNSSFQFNGIAAQFVSNYTIWVNDSIFVGNVEALLAFNSSRVVVRDTNFVGTLDYILKNDQDSTGSIEFTKRGELNGGRFQLRGTFQSTADSLILKSLKMIFATPIGILPGASIRNAASLTMTGVSLANNSVPFYFEIEGSTGNLTQVSIRGAWPSLARPGEGPFFLDSTLNLRDFAVNESTENFTAVGSQLFAYNVSVRENQGAGLVLRSSLLNGTAIAILDSLLCGVNASQGSRISATNLTVRGNRGGSLCLSQTNVDVLDGDFASGGGARDLTLDGGSQVYLVSTGITRGYLVNDTSVLTIAWRLDVRVSYSNAALLPLVNVTVIDVKAHATRYSPSASGAVDAIGPQPERIVTSSGADVRTPYTVLASYEGANASATVSLTADRQVPLELDDLVAPSVWIDSPADGTGFNVSSVTFTFRAFDGGSRVDLLQYRFGAGAFTSVAYQPGPYTVNRDLVDGDHTFVVRAVDFGGNVGETQVNFTVDTRNPLITVVAPRAPGNVTRATEVSVQVTVEPDVVAVLIGGVEANITSGSAGRSVAIPEGASPIVIEARDHVGNIGTITVYVFGDRTAPSLTLESMDNTTAQSFIVVRGHTEPGSQVVFGNTAVPTENGSFEIVVNLLEGKNTFEVRSRDALQNENSTQFTVYRGTIPPSHQLDLVATLVGIALFAVGAAVALIVFRRARKVPEPGGGPK